MKNRVVSAGGAIAVVLTLGAGQAFGVPGTLARTLPVGLGASAPSAASGQYQGGSDCIEYVNPHGQTIPPAGQTSPGTNPRSGQNPDGFYQVSTANGDVVVIDQGSGTVFGPYPSGTVIKYTQAPGGTPSAKTIGSANGQAGAVLVHITGTGDAGVQAASGGPVTSCLVPPKPK